VSDDIMFWRGTPSAPIPISGVYSRLSEGQAVDGLEQLPTETIIDRIRDVYPESERTGAIIDCAGEEGSFQVSWSSQHIRIDSYGLPREEINRLMSIVQAFGCVMFDPSINRLFDGTDPRGWPGNKAYEGHGRL
jgi:hypothetical protein